MVLVPFIYMYQIGVLHRVLIYTCIQFIVVGWLHTLLYCGSIRISANAERSRGDSRRGNRTMDIRYIVIAETGSWGAAKTLRKACRQAHLIEQTWGSHFEYAVSPDEFAENWRSWEDWAKDECAEPNMDPVRIVIYPLDMDQWESYSICNVTGALSASPKGSAAKGRNGSEAATTPALRDICIKAEWINGAIKPTPAA